MDFRDSHGCDTPLGPIFFRQVELSADASTADVIREISKHRDKDAIQVTAKGHTLMAHPTIRQRQQPSNPVPCSHMLLLVVACLFCFFACFFFGMCVRVCR